MPKTDLDQRSINALRVLAMDGVQKANSGHPGMPMGMADVAYVLWTRHLKHNPKDPLWPNRDRFILSAGHGSMLLYSLLYLTGYPISLDDLKQFRQWGSKTAGHPEYEAELGIEPERVEMFNLSAGEGPRFVEIAKEMSERIQELGPSPVNVQKKAA